MSYELSKVQKTHLSSLINNPNKGHEFSYYICNKLLKENKKYIENFYTDGSEDRGIDFVFVRINNKIVCINEAIDKLKNKEVISINVNIFQCKNERKETSSLSENESNKINSFLSSVENLCLNRCEFNSEHLISNDRMKNFINMLMYLYDFQDSINDIYFEYNYIDTVLDFDEFQTEKVKNDMGRNIENILIRLYGNRIKITYDTYSRLTINELYNKCWGYKKQLRGLKNHIEDESIKDGLLAIVLVKELFKCITDSENYDINEFKRNYNDIIFDNNVRGFLGKNKVNKAIIETCESLISDVYEGKKIAFWAKNNGITILCENYEMHPNGVLDIFNLKVINGLQTISSINEFINENEYLTFDQLDNIKVQIKVLKKEGLGNKEIEDIIIATNTQTQVKYLDLISINEDLKKLEFKLYDNDIDYIRRKKQKSKKNCSIEIKHSELLQLIITCFKEGPSAAKNKLEQSLYTINEMTGEKELIDFKPYWNSAKFDKLLKAIVIYDKLKVKERSDKMNQVLKYGKLHATFCALNILNCNPDDNESIENSISIMNRVFEEYRDTKSKITTIEQMSKNISASNIKTIIREKNLINSNKRI